MSSPSDLGFSLSNGTRIVHGDGSIVRTAFPPSQNLPGTLQLFSLGHAMDKSCPAFCGSSGLFEFDTTCRMPRHVHISTPSDEGSQPTFAVEKILVLNGIAVAELGGEIYVIPPKTLVIIAPGVPHTWVAAPEGLDLHELGVVPDSAGSGEKVPTSEGTFLAVFEYNLPTTFFPTKQSHKLVDVTEYARCDDLHSIRIPEFSIGALKKQAKFVWGRSCRKLHE
ncbi:uncharacterized protein A1O9_11564 [Exophiala aquamarina CBS 119918]|uniref:Uncharacterized protein n=1 Tax=Exophiala aquamarina CBS 119918 TaxID=1182545 RepID=A0A072NWV4_9EURO|nr:uncharacterized protein A1O9_11564 [Exophiala aquamarina CBS 119918]KEF52324.1 hypothetical protein A1O9_11564 [Exophiala aquamarina CBS 119918]